MPHFPISFRFHKSLLFLVNFFQDDTRGAARKLLIITALTVFRVVKIPTLEIPKRLLLSGLQVALAEAVLWRWQAEQRHGPRRIAKHPELSGLLPLPGRGGTHRSKPGDPRWNPRWNSDGSKGIRDGIPDGAQMEAKEAKEYKIDSQDRIQVTKVTQVTPEEMPGT